MADNECHAGSGRGSQCQLVSALRSLVKYLQPHFLQHAPTALVHFFRLMLQPLMCHFSNGRSSLREEVRGQPAGPPSCRSLSENVCQSVAAAAADSENRVT